MQVLYEDAHLIAVNKPGGLATQADRTGDPHLLERMAVQRTGDRSLGLPHRLDRPVSGVVVLTRSPEALAAMNLLFAERAVHKRYWAIVSGTPGIAGTWTHRLAHDARRHRAVITPDGSVEPCTVAYSLLVSGDRYSLIELVPEGGRFHQLRAQCSAAGFPIKGDVKYGARRGERDRTIALHARAITFTHPFTGEPTHIEADAPNGGLWQALLSRMTRH